MRWTKNSLLALGVASLGLLPLPASALLVQFCMPVCEGTDPLFIRQFGPGAPADVSGVTVNSISTGTFQLQRDGKSFTITGTITSQQSATLQKITFNPTSITADLGSTCSVLEPCRLEIIATSDQLDFPAPKPVGGYPAGAFMIGSFTGPQGANPTGDTISSTGEASGAGMVSVANPDGTSSLVFQPFATDVVNATPGTGPGNVGTSLPSTCTGTISCKFIANTFKKAFSTQITETVQQQCGVEESSCLTRLRTKLNIEIKTAGNRVSLPYDWATTNFNPANPTVNPTEELVSATVASLANFDVNSLAVGPNHFVISSKLNLGADGSIDPVNEEVFIRVAGFSTSILPGQFKRLQDGRLFTLNGKVDGRQVNATFVRDRSNPALWEIIMSVFSVDLAPLLPPAPLLVPVEIGIGSDIGKDLVTARVFGNPK